MRNAINVNSQEWCDIVFEGKNKSYGAYSLRQSAGKRNLMAFGVVLLIVVFVALLPLIINSVKAATAKYTGSMSDDYKISVVENKPEPIEEIIDPKTPEPPKYISSIKFIPPVIGTDESVSEENELHDMEKIVNAKITIGNYDVDNGSTDEGAILKKLEGEIMGKGAGHEDTNTIVKFAEIMPQFPGGEQEMYRFISENLKYPVPDQEMGIQGRVTIRFVVSKTGEIKDAEIQKGISPSCDKEALKVIKSMPRWIPGKQNGNPVAVYYTIPVVFKLKQ